MPRVRAQFEAMMLEPLLQPFADAFGEFGSVAADRFAQLLAREFDHDRS
jgi:hypothetical protein